MAISQTKKDFRDAVQELNLNLPLKEKIKLALKTLLIKTPIWEDDPQVIDFVEETSRTLDKYGGEIDSSVDKMTPEELKYVSDHILKLNQELNQQ